MALVYHGAILERGLKIASKGEILSPFQQELECGKKCPWLDDVVSVVIEEIGQCKGHATWNRDYENYEGGIILGIELPSPELQKIKLHFKKGDVLFIPERLSIDRLKEVHLSQKVNRDYRSRAEEAFLKYRPKYLVIDRF